MVAEDESVGMSCWRLTCWAAEAGSLAGRSVKTKTDRAGASATKAVSSESGRRMGQSREVGAELRRSWLGHAHSPS